MNEKPFYTKQDWISKKEGNVVIKPTLFLTREEMDILTRLSKENDISIANVIKRLAKGDIK